VKILCPVAELAPLAGCIGGFEKLKEF